MSAGTIDEIREFWDAEALRYGNARTGAHSDPYLVELENWFIIEKCLKRIRPKGLIDVGCGNGQRTRLFSEHVSGKVVGIDFSGNMVSMAEKLSDNRIHFYHADILEEESLRTLYGRFDCVISCRCLINLGSVQNQLAAIDHIHSLLSSRGMFVFCEGSRQGTERLNGLRAKLGLKPIIPVRANLDLDESIVMPYLQRKFNVFEKTTFATYYLLTRVYYPGVIRPEEPDPTSKFNAVAAHLAMQIEQDVTMDYGRHLCACCQKRD